MSDFHRFRTALRKTAGAPPPPTPAEWSKLAGDPRARIPPRRSRMAGWIAAGAAAGVLLVALQLGRGGRLSTTPFANWIEAHEVSAQQSLDDGTTIELDPGASGAVGDAREDYVRFDLRRGRARFDVTPNPRRSFHVAASGYDVRVLGTRFAVELVAGGQEVSVIVERGSVSVTPPGEAATVMLGPGDRLDGPRDRPEVHRAAPAETALDAKQEPSAPIPVEADNSARPEPGPRPATLGSTGEKWWLLYREGKYAASLDAARKIGFPRLLRDLDADRLAALADAARFAGDVPHAVQALAALERRFSGKPEAAQATFLLGRLSATSGDTQPAVAAFERYLDRNPGGAYATEAVGRLAELYSKRGDRSRARAMAERYLERAPGGPYARLARSLTANP